MIAKSTIKTVRSVVKPLVDVGVVGPDEYQEMLQLMVNSTQVQKAEEAEPDKKYLKRKQIAKMFNVSERQVDRLMHRYGVRKVRIGPRGIRYLEEDVMTLVKIL